jgi:2,4-diaminopentanoate dehydrogenase
MINIVQLGIGALGKQVLQYLNERNGIHVTGVVDPNPELTGKDLSTFTKSESTGVLVSKSLDEALDNSIGKPEVAVITTVSSISKLLSQVEAAAKAGLNIVSTCEELIYPWNQHPSEAKTIDEICKKNGVSCLGTGVNPGFLMDYLPAAFTSICQRVDSVTIERVQDASVRRVPFQQKIGAGLTHEEFEAKKKDGSLRHVGLPESVDLIAAAMGWKLDENRETLNPVIANTKITNGYKPIDQGMPAGVQQVGSGIINGEEVIKLIFRAAVGEEKSYDKIIIKGLPNVTTEIDGGINGDVATCAITVNAVRSVVNTTPGLKTMLDVPVPSYFSAIDK